MEETVDSGYKNHGGGQHKRTNHCKPQQLVVRLQTEHALVHAACVVRMEQFRHGQRKKCHRHALVALQAAVFYCFADKVRRKRNACKHYSVKYYVYAQSARKNVFVFFTRQTAHRVFLGGFHAKRDGRQTVGYKVYPQQVGGHKQRKAANAGHKHGDYFGKVA